MNGTSTKVNTAILSRIDNDLHCTNDTDPEVKQRWYPTCLYVSGISGSNYTAAYDPAFSWISSQGRMKYINPVYNSLMMSGQKNTAVAWNAANANFYSNLAEQGVLQIINGVVPGATETPKKRRR